MLPLDGIHKANKKSKIYRTSDRVNFLLNGNSPQEKQEKTEDFQKAETLRPRGQKRVGLNIALTLVVIFIVCGAMFLSEKIFNSNGGVLSDINKYNPFARLSYLLTQSDKRLSGELDDRINILLLGVGGEGHDGPFLTDTIIFASIKPTTGEIGLVSLPRDMVVPIGRNMAWQKINQIYATGLSVSEEQGVKDITKTIENIIDQPAHYWALVTFDGFKQFIDEIGGITVDVPKSFFDTSYPTIDGKTTTVSFTAGLQLMNGSTALNYARSRHGTNFEDSDFARSRRQQLIIEAVKNKLFTFSTLLSPAKLQAIYDLLGDTVKTNISIWQGLKLASLAKNTSEEKIYRVILDDGPDSLLEGGFSEDGAYILQPKDGNYNQLAMQVRNLFNISKIREENAEIEIQNGTDKAGLAYWTTVALEKLGYKIISYRNSDRQDYQKTIILDVSEKEKKNSLKWLEDELNAETEKKYLTDENNIAAESGAKQPDIIIILGQDHAAKFKLPEEKPFNAPTSSPALNATSSTTINATSTGDKLNTL